MSRQAPGAALRPRKRFYHPCSCGRLIPEGVTRCSARTCPEFAPIWARDTRRRLFVNLEQLKLSVMFSVTAPGADLYPFDPQFCSHSPSKDALAQSAVESLRTWRRRSMVKPVVGGASSIGRRRRGLTGRQGSRGNLLPASGRNRSEGSLICTA
jgi:hypothetical protein